MKFTSETGRKAGAKSKRGASEITKALRHTYAELMEGETQNIREALDKLRQEDCYKYLTIVDKLLTHLIPKPAEEQTRAELPSIPPITFKYTTAPEDIREDIREEVLQGKEFTLNQLTGNH